MKTITIEITDATYRRLRSTLNARMMSLGGGMTTIMEAVIIRILKAYEDDEEAILLQLKEEVTTVVGRNA